MGKENKRNDFKNNIKVTIGTTAAGLAAVGTVVGFGVASQDTKSIDMSNYNIDNTKYMEYAKTDDEDTMYRLARLEDNIRLYNSLSSEKLTDAQVETFNKVKSEIKLEMMSKMTSKLYLNMFKEKMKTAYDADDIKIEGKEFKNFSVEITRNYSKSFMDNKDKSREIESAVWDIIELQDMQEKVSYEDKDVESFVRLYENMKGFSNLEFVKEDGKPLSMNETYKTTLADGSYTVYHMDLSDKENPKVESKTEIEVRNGLVNEGEER